MVEDKKNAKNKKDNKEKKEEKKKVFLSLFGFQVRRYKGKDKSHYEFDKVPTSKKTSSERYILIDIVKQLFDEHTVYRKDKEDKGLLLKINEEFSDPDYICGTLKYGADRDPKTEANWDNLNDSREIDPNNIVLRDYYFLLKLPNNTNIGCLILERKGSSGVQELFMTWLRKSFRAYTDYKHIFPEISDMVPIEVEKYYKKGIAIRLEYIYNSVSTDNLGDESIKAKKIAVQIPIENKKKKTIPDLAKNLVRKLPFIDKKPDQIKAVSKYDKKDKVFDIDNEGKVKPYVEITELLDLLTDYDQNKNPEFKSIHREAKKMMENNFNKIWKGDIAE